MSSEVSVRLEGLPDLQKILREVGSLRPVKRGLGKAALHLKGKIAKYPPVSRRPQPFKTDLQRRGFFAKLKSGQIEVPYRRGISPNSETLGRSWTTKAELSGLRWVVGNDTSYGPLVQDSQKQARYHQITGWKTTGTVAEAEAKKVSEILKVEVDKALEGKNA